MAQQVTPPETAAAAWNFIFHENGDADANANANANTKANAKMGSTFGAFRDQLVQLNEEYQQTKAELKKAEKDRDLFLKRILEIRSSSREEFEGEKYGLEYETRRLERKEAGAEERLRLLLVTINDCVAAMREAANRAP